ncbi:MAG: hypothetical protein AAFY20_27330, partial [Cyanobacteria bacterium J06639_14]
MHSSCLLSPISYLLSPAFLPHEDPESVGTTGTELPAAAWAGTRACLGLVSVGWGGVILMACTCASH